MLCFACKQLFQGQDQPWYYIKEGDASVPAYQHHSSPAKLAQAADDGCHICSIIWRKLALDEKTVLLNTWDNPYLHRASQAFQRIWSISIAYYSWSPVWWSAEDFGIRFQFGDAPFWKKIVFRLLPVSEETRLNEDEDAAKFANEVVASPTSPTPFPELPDHSYPHTHSMWSRHTQRLVQRWYSECITTHDFCRMKDVGQVENGHLHRDFQPTRILDLSDAKIRLDIAPQQRQGERYASLTHRWSLHPETMPRLHPDVLEKWCESIDLSILTPTFRDAIDVARKLQVRYLWIDSLCILQHGEGWVEDWQRESAVMGEVYRHAFLNIQAGRDEEALEMGLFRAPINRDIDPFRVDISRQIFKPRSREKPSITIRIQGPFSIIEEDFARDELLGNPINRRGWVLQERLLSHRITHFGAQQVFWECRELLACETFPEGLPKTIPKTLARAATQVARHPTFDPKTIARTIKRQMTASLTNDDVNTFDPLASVTAVKPTVSIPIDPKLPVPSFPSLTVHRDLFAWFYLAELYSACSLTRETDKLVAISGLAQIFGSPTFHDRAADVVAYLRNLALPRAGGAVTDFHFDFDAIPSSDSDTQNPDPTSPSSNQDTRPPPVNRYHKPSQHLISRHGHLGTLETGDYLAGLWRYELIPCLLWHMANGRQHNGLRSTRIPHDATSGRAPSWSWASVNGLLHASIYQNWSMGIDGVVLAEVSGAQTTKTFGGNAWGGVTAGKIVMAGRCVFQKDIIWPSVEEVEELAGVKVRAHMNEVHASMVRRIKLNSASVARQRVLKADVTVLADDMLEFSSALRRSMHGHGHSHSHDHRTSLLSSNLSIRSRSHSRGRSRTPDANSPVHPHSPSASSPSLASTSTRKYQISLLPLIGLQRRRADWSKVEGYTDEIFEWHGLVVGLSKRSLYSRNASPHAHGRQHLDLGAGLGAGGVGAALSMAVAPVLGHGLGAPRLAHSSVSGSAPAAAAGATPGRLSAHVYAPRPRRELGDDTEWVAERLGYFRCRDTEVFKFVVDKERDIEMLIL